MSKNINCLEGLACPKCGQDDELLVVAKMWVSLRDDGTDPFADSTKMCGDVEYDNDSSAQCPECGFHGELRDFMVVKKKKRKA